MSIYDIEVKDIDMNSIKMEEFKGKTLLIVNVASACGFTPQYTGLQNLYDRYKDKGLEILAFPCNQFGAQEKGTNEEIKDFCDTKYNVSFRLFDKIDVNGENASPLFVKLAEKAGHKAVYLSGSGVAAASYGLPDLGVTSMEDVLIDAKRITNATSLPLLVDVDTGWGDSKSISKTIEALVSDRLANQKKQGVINGYKKIV